MKQPIHKLFSALSLSLCSVLAVGFLISGPSAPGANEILSQAPKGLSDTFLSQSAQYFSDHFYGRQELITAYARLNATLFRSSVREDVTLGQDGWLYYSSTLPDYTGQTRLDISRAAHNLELMAEYCQSQNIDFLFVGVPNKNTLYPEHMPSRISSVPEHDLHRLDQRLTFPVLDIESIRPPYFAHDSHWNSRGAAMAADAINASLGKNSKYQEDAFAASIPHQGDLFEMLYPAGLDDEIDPVYGRNLSFAFAENSGRTPNSITIRTESPAEGSLLMYRDSFGNLLYPYLADSFGRAVFSRSTTYDLSQLEDVSAVVIELVERNLTYLTKYAPTMPAPSRSMSEGTPLQAALTSKPSPIPGYTLYQGTTQEEGEIILCTDESGFACFLMDDGSFTAHIPENQIITGIIIKEIEE